MQPAEPPPCNRKQELEKQRIKARLQGFDPKSSFVWIRITERFGANLTHAELLKIAEVLASKAGVTLDRDAKRRKKVLLKWFEEHWSLIHPFLQYIVLEDRAA